MLKTWGKEVELYDIVVVLYHYTGAKGFYLAQITEIIDENHVKVKLLAKS